MKQMLFLSLIFGFALNVSAQKIKEKEIDKFTKLENITTSRETLYTRTIFLDGKYSFGFYIKKQGADTYTIFANITTPRCAKYDTGNGITLLLSNGETIKLETSYTGVSSVDSNKLWHFETAFVVSKELVNLLKEHDVTDVRLTTIDSYYDFELKDKKRSLLKKMFIMLDE